MLRRGLTAAGLVIAAVVLMAGGRGGAAGHTTAAHSCTALDKQFVKAASLSSTSIMLLGQDYSAGDVEPKDAIYETQQAMIGIDITDPQDASLKLVKSLMHGMFVEYGRAIRAQWKGKGDPGEHMYRSYSLANYAHQVLLQAQPGLEAKGCPLADLL